MAEIRSPRQEIGRLLWRKQTLRIDFSESANDPNRTLAIQPIVTGMIGD